MTEWRGLLLKFSQCATVSSSLTIICLSWNDPIEVLGVDMFDMFLICSKPGLCSSFRCFSRFCKSSTIFSLLFSSPISRKMILWFYVFVFLEFSPYYSPLQSPERWFYVFVFLVGTSCCLIVCWCLLGSLYILSPNLYSLYPYILQSGLPTRVSSYRLTITLVNGSKPLWQLCRRAFTPNNWSMTDVMLN